MKSFPLNPVNGRKSFYGKCMVDKIGDNYFLRSYDTYVAYVDKYGDFHKLWDDYSSTTMNHINAFLDYFDIDGGGKGWWMRLPVEDAPREINSSKKIRCSTSITAGEVLRLSDGTDVTVFDFDDVMKIVEDLCGQEVADYINDEMDLWVNGYLTLEEEIAKMKK